MITYIKMKRKEHKLKLALYTDLEAVLKEKADIKQIITDLYKSLKGTSINDLQDKFIMALAEIVNDHYKDKE